MREQQIKTGLPICVFCNQSVSAGSTKCPKCGAALGARDAATAADPASSGTVDDVVSMLEQGRKSDAVRVYREQTCAGVREATAAVDAIDRIEKAPLANSYASRASREANFKADLWALIQNGQKIEAIDLYRKLTGQSLQKAREAVESLTREHGGGARGTGCFGALVLCLAPVALLAVWLA